MNTLQRELATAIATPRRWVPADASDEMKQAAVNRLKQEVFSRLHELAHRRLFADHIKQWQIAWERSGVGSARYRAHDISGIYDLVAPLMTEPPVDDDLLIREVRTLFEEAARSAGSELVTDSDLPPESARLLC